MKPAGGPSFRELPALSRSNHTSIVCARSLTGSTPMLRKVNAPAIRDAAGAICFRGVFVSEPGAVATGSRVNLRNQRHLAQDRQLNGRSGRIHHPTRDARAGTPVRYPVLTQKLWRSESA